MSPDHPPIPLEALPPGWGPATCRDGRIEYRCGQPPVTLVADRTAADRSHPGLGLCHCWELRYRFSLGDRTVVEPVDQVSTRRAAVEGLLECMHAINEAVDDLDDPVAVETALERVRFSDGIPGRSTSPE